MSSLAFPGAPSYVSHSAFEDFNRCGVSFELKRVEKAEQRPMWAGVGGSAVHTLTEEFDRGEIDAAAGLDELFQREFDKARQDSQQRSPNTPVEEWYATAGGKRDEDWWREHGPEFVRSYIDWRNRTGWDILEIDGEPCIETRLQAELPNGPLVLGFVDRIFVMPSGEPVVVDLKNSARKPDTNIQLGMYKVLFWLLYAIDIPWGVYWTSQKWGKVEAGTHTTPVPLDNWTPELLAEMYNRFIASVNAGLFLPKVSNMCVACPVIKHCGFQNSASPRDSLSVGV